MEENEKSSFLGKAMHVGERLVEVGGEATRLKTAASHAVEDAVTEAKRLAKRSRYAAEDLIEDANPSRQARSATFGGPRLCDRLRHGRAGCLDGDEQRQRVAKKREKKE
jgi:hypothetical protein